MLIPFGARWLRLAMIEGVLAAQTSALNNQSDSEGSVAALVDLGASLHCVFGDKSHSIHRHLVFALFAVVETETVKYCARRWPGSKAWWMRSLVW